MSVSAGLTDYTPPFSLLRELSLWGLGLPCKWCQTTLQPPFPTISSCTKGKGGRRETGSLLFQLTCRCSHGSSDKYRLGTLLCGPRGDGRTPGKGCLPGVGAETWPGSLSPADTPGWPAHPPPRSISWGGRGQTSMCPWKAPVFPRHIASPLLPAQDPGQFYGALFICYTRLHRSLGLWDDPPSGPSSP